MEIFRIRSFFTQENMLDQQPQEGRSLLLSLDLSLLFVQEFHELDGLQTAVFSMHISPQALN